MDLLYSIAQAGSGARAQNRLAGWAGWAGWLAGLAGLQSAVCSVPEDSVPFGRGPAGCGAAANQTLTHDVYMSTKAPANAYDEIPPNTRRAELRHPGYS